MTFDDLLRTIVREEVARQLAELRNPTTDPWLTVKAAAERASVSPATVRRWARAGSVETRGTGKLLRVSLESLSDFLGRPSRTWTITAPGYSLTPEELADRDEEAIARRPKGKPRKPPRP